LSFTGSIAFFGVSDLAATDEFYSNKLELELYKDQGLCRIYRVPGGGMIGFCSHMAVTAREKSPILTFLTEDVNGWYARLNERGAVMEGGPKSNPRFNIYHFFLVDPDGYTVEIQRFLD